jgi:hypothetical protein
MQPLFEGLTLIIAVGIASRQAIIKVRKRKGNTVTDVSPPEVNAPAATET